MSCSQRPGLLLCSVLSVSLLAGCAASGGGGFMGSDDNSAFGPAASAGNTEVEMSSSNTNSGMDADVQSQADAQELRLKVRELAAQLLETRTNEGLVGLIALPTSFVNLNNFNQTSSLGRYMAEAMYYEFNQRGFLVREYRLDGSIRMREGAGEFALTRNLPPLAVNQTWGAVLVGTYLKENGSIFINARLVRPDGMVLRTAQLILNTNPMIARMSTLPPFSSGNLRIVAPGNTFMGRPVSPTPSKRRSTSRRKTSSAGQARSIPVAPVPSVPRPQVLNPLQPAVDTTLQPPMPGPLKNT